LVPYFFPRLLDCLEEWSFPKVRLGGRWYFACQQQGSAIYPTRVGSGLILFQSPLPSRDFELGDVSELPFLPHSAGLSGRIVFCGTAIHSLVLAWVCSLSATYVTKGPFFIVGRVPTSSFVCSCSGKQYPYHSHASDYKHRTTFVGLRSIPGLS